MTRAARALGATVLTVAVLLGGPAAQADEPSPVRFDLGAGTFFPLDIGAEATVELPLRILLQADVGWMPGPYSNTIVDLLNTFGAINSFERQLLEETIQNSLVARFSAGWRPFPALGLEVLAGYTLVTVGGGVSGSDVIQAYLQSRGSTDQVPANTNHDVPVSTTLQSFHATVDYRFVLLDDHLVLRASLGYLQCLGSSTSIGLTPSRPAAQATYDKLNGEIASDLNAYYTEYVKIPVVGFTAAYRF
jgi:hypothetical protein